MVTFGGDYLSRKGFDINGILLAKKLYIIGI